MGVIHEYVINNHLTKYPSEEEFLKPFLSGFDITWATSRKAYNSFSSIYFLNPEPFIKEAYGFDFEIMLVYSKYDKMEPRTIQAAEQFLSESPAKGRVDSVNFFLVSESKDISTWTDSYLSSRQESRIIVTFNKDELLKNKGDNWFVRNRLNEQFYGRDLFAYTLPLTEDTYFFGRQQTIASVLDAIKLSENRGIFGLRKTGKTSLLLKMKRIITQECLGQVFFYDCKLPSIRKLHWNELLGDICNAIAQRARINFKKDYSQLNVGKTFKFIIRTLASKNIKIILVFDEIEYISFKSLQDDHWHSEFLDFWQTMWSCQTIYKNLVFIIAGVNPSVVETDTVNKVQNPLFGIVPSEYLKGFEENELKSLVRTLGKRMGLKFQPDALEYLHTQYGGHPLLTRLSCSWINKYLQLQKLNKPYELSSQLLKSTESDRNSDLTFYCKHIVSELKDFYPDEYEMLELLASGQVFDFVELSTQPEFIKHLTSYGLLKYNYSKNPVIAIPVVSRYVGIELAKKERRTTIYKLIDQSRRIEWLEIRKSSIASDIKLLEKSIKINSQPLLFGVNSFPEGEEFFKIGVVDNKGLFQNFINVMNRCFVESIENYGKSILLNKYFWNEIKTSYPSLYQALLRIKTYRNDSDHLELNSNTNQQLTKFLTEDLEGIKPSDVKELYFQLQQVTIDSFLSAINTEINAQN